jgi:hypothetical protein
MNSVSNPTPAERAPSVGCKAWRRANLAALCAQACAVDAKAGYPARGGSKRMAMRLGLAPAALSNMLHGVKNIGDEAARSIESKLGQAPGSLDAPPFCLAFDSQSQLDAAKALLGPSRAEAS